jgi:nicotinate (nicotinamide) nucleotide adenylyltransferase
MSGRARRTVVEHKAGQLRIALYGLSANPVHNAHLAIIKALSSRFDLVFVWAVDNPDKYGIPNYLPLAIRNEMVDAALNDLKLPNVENTPQWSHPYTGESVQMIRKVYPSASLWIVLGSDSIKSVSTWSGGDLMNAADGFIEVTRPGLPIGPSTQLIGGKSMPVIVMDIKTPPYSSSEIRAKFILIYKEVKELLQMLPPSVFNFIIKGWLYK